MDLTDTIIPKSDQLNAEDLLTGPRTVTITEVRRGSDEQPVNIHLAESPGRPFRPSKTVLRILVAAWGKDSDAYVGRRLTLYRDPEVRFAGLDVGGIRVSHMSHIAKPLKLALTVSKGKKAPYVVQPLADDAPSPVAADRIEKMVAAFGGIGVTVAQIEDKVGRKRGQWTAADVAQMGVVFASIRSGDTTKDDEFPPAKVTAAETASGRGKPSTSEDSSQQKDEPTEPPLDGDWPTVTEPGGER